MSDKLIKRESTVEPAKAFVDAVERVLKDERPAIVAEPAYCVCLHSKAMHDERGCQVVTNLPVACMCTKYRPAVHIDTAILATEAALARCPNCGNANMNDAQAQFVGACSPRCAKALGISDEVMRASGSIRPSLLEDINNMLTGISNVPVGDCGVESPTVDGERRTQRLNCRRMVGHDGHHAGNAGDDRIFTWIDSDKWR